MSEWISVKDRLPPDDVRVLLLADWDWNNGTNVRRASLGYYESRTKGHLGQSGFVWETPPNYASIVEVDITHWMPMPELPK